jgi:CHAT domain-containing protein/cytochrome c-type biogenesis protein CcmH/NrfG
LDQHLGSDQIDELLQSATGDKPDQTTNREHLENARRHLKDCAGCQTRLRAHEQAMERLALLNPTTPGAKGPICPPDDVWLEIAAGIAPQDFENYLSHAAQCDHCGPLLRQSNEDFAAELTQDEESRIADLPSSTSEWQRTLATRLGNAAAVPLEGRIARLDQKPPRLTAFLSLGPLALTAAVAAVAIFGVWFAFHLWDGETPERLITNAYAEKRTLEIRIEGAPYVPLRQERGSDSGQSRMNRPALLKAEAEISRKLQSRPDDVRWLQASGRASLLEDDAPGSEAAIAVLEKAHRLAPNEPSVSVDLASSYILRGQFLKRPEDYGTAIEILGTVLSSHGDDETAQFNYAIALEKELLKRQAIEAWQTFLARYPQSSWTREAQEHLASLTTEVREQQERNEAPLKAINEVALAFRRRDQKQIAEIDARIEEYQDLAVQTWLPQLYSSDAVTENARTNIEDATTGLAQLLSNHHADDWLTDLLEANRRSAVVSEAIQLLGESVITAATSNTSQAESDASAALLLFHRSRLPAGEMRSHLVLILVAQLEHHDLACETMAQAMLRRPSLQKYAWIRIQAQIEDSICANVSDKQALEATQSAIDMAKSHFFPILALRAISAQSTLYSTLGDPHRSWSAGEDALRTYWNGRYPKHRGYNTLVALDEINLTKDHWFLQSAILKEALSMVDGDPRTSMVAVAQAQLGQALMQTGDFEGAETSYRRTESLLNQSAPGPQRQVLGAEAELGFAKVELRRGRFAASLDRLERIRPELQTIPDDFLLLDFYQTSGIANLRSGHFNTAEKDLNEAIQIAEKGLRQVDTEDDRWKWSHQNEPLYRAIVEVTLHSDPRRALLDWEWFKGSALRAQSSLAGRKSSSAQWPLTSEEDMLVIPEIDEQTAQVTFSLFPHGYAVWVLDHSGLREKWVSADDKELSDLVTQFVDHCADPRSNLQALRDEGATLYKKIFLPIEPWIAGRHHLIVEPDGVLKSLPIGLLINSSGRYFEDTVSISISPGTAYVNMSRRWSGITAASNALIVGDPPAIGWMPLPDAEAEAHAVASSFKNPDLLVRVDGPRTELTKEIAEADVVHFSGHAQASVESAGLVTADYILFDNPALQALSQGRSQLVVLSACASSEGTGGLFDDNDSTVRRVMSARVPDVIASRWAVDSAATALLMRGFYRELLSGERVSDSLEYAMRSVRARSEFAHPYYWGGFSVFGRQ